MAWALYLLAKHPTAMAKLEAELDAAGLLVTPARPHPRPFTFPDISKLPYLDAVLKARRACGRAHAAKGHAGSCEIIFNARPWDGAVCVPKSEYNKEAMRRRPGSGSGFACMVL